MKMHPSQEIRNFDPAEGMARQGDVLLIQIPGSIPLDKGATAIDPVGGRLILLEGEVTGHHHAVHLNDNGGADVMERSADVEAAKPRKASKAVENLLSGAVNPTKGTAKLFKDSTVAQKLVDAKILTRADLYVATLLVEGNTMLLKHDEHAAIRIPPGSYYVGRQVESAGAEERMVRD